MHSFVVYIDEAGDEGFNFERGSSGWFVLSAAITHSRTDLETVKLVDRVRVQLKKTPRADLHFRKLKHQQRLVFAREIMGGKLRAVSILVHKPSIREVERFSGRFRLYFYCVRLLLERVSWYCRDHPALKETGDGSAKIYFSNRSSMSYEELREYLRMLKKMSEAQDIRINWKAIRPSQMAPYPAHRMMGLQIADAIASSWFVAVEPGGHGFTEDRYARMLKPITYKHRGRFWGYGVKIWPAEAEKLVASDQLHALWRQDFS